jgi:hypothetical protein
LHHSRMHGPNRPRSPRGLGSRARRLLIPPHLQPGEDFLGLGQVTDEFPRRRGEFLDQRRGGDDLPFPGAQRLLVDMDK